MIPAHIGKKVDEVRGIVDRELGFMNSDKMNEECVTFLYICNKRVHGCLIAEPIEKAYQILPNTQRKENKITDLETINAEIENKK